VLAQIHAAGIAAVKACRPGRGYPMSMEQTRLFPCRTCDLDLVKEALLGQSRFRAPIDPFGPRSFEADATARSRHQAGRSVGYLNGAA
jgi:hypothetical protein